MPDEHGERSSPSGSRSQRPKVSAQGQILEIGLREARKKAKREKKQKTGRRDQIREPLGYNPVE